MFSPDHSRPVRPSVERDVETPDHGSKLAHAPTGGDKSSTALTAEKHNAQQNGQNPELGIKVRSHGFARGSNPRGFVWSFVTNASGTDTPVRMRLGYAQETAGFRLCVTLCLFRSLVLTVTNQYPLGSIDGESISRELD